MISDTFYLFGVFTSIIRITKAMFINAATEVGWFVTVTQKKSEREPSASFPSSLFISLK
jgi:hypothetical protein